MIWTLLKRQQQRGAQLPGPGKAPPEATRDRAAQDHEQAGATPQAGEAPASPIEHRDQDNTPAAADPHVEWDEVIQPEGRQAGETELTEDQRGDDAEPVPDAQAQQALEQLGERETIAGDAEALDEAARGDRND